MTQAKAEELAKAVNEAADALHKSAIQNKHSCAAHRKQMHTCMRSLDKLRDFCNDHGIKLEIDTHPTGGGKDHGQRIHDRK